MCTYVWLVPKVREGVRAKEPELMMVVIHPVGPGSHPGPLQEQQMLLTTKLFIQSPKTLRWGFVYIWVFYLHVCLSMCT